MNKNLQRTYRQVLYSLKRQYGDKITICQHVTSSTNYTTGAKSYTCSRTDINKAILLPTNFTRKTDYKLPMMSANKLFIFGATFDVGEKVIVVDLRDVPTYFELSQDDWIIIDGNRYEISKIEELEYQAGWVIGAKQLPGSPVELEVAQTISDSMSVSHSEVEIKEAERSLTNTLSLTDSNSSEQIYGLFDSLGLSETLAEVEEIAETITSNLGLTSNGSYIL